MEQAAPFPALKQWITLHATVRQLMAVLKRAGLAVKSPHSRQRLDGPSGIVWEDSQPFRDVVQLLVNDGQLDEALAVADRWLPEGAPDWLLHDALAQKVVAKVEPLVGEAAPGLARGDAGAEADGWSAIHALVMRLRNPEACAKLLLECISQFSLDEGLEALRHCGEALGEGGAAKEVAKALETLQTYREILEVDSRFNGNVSMMASMYSADPRQLARGLASSGHHDVALKVARNCKLPASFQHQILGAKLSALLRGDPLAGSGPARAVALLREEIAREHVLQVAEAAFASQPELGLEHVDFLVAFLIAEYGSGRSAALSGKQLEYLKEMHRGLQTLKLLPEVWQARCRHLLKQPRLIVESLLMHQQFQLVAAAQALDDSLLEDATVAMYAEKALLGAAEKVGAEAGGGADPAGPPPPKRGHRGARTSSIFTSFDDQDQELHIFGADVRVLQGHEKEDARLRGAHTFAAAPSAALFKAVLALARDPRTQVQLGASILETAPAVLLGQGRKRQAPPAGDGADEDALYAAFERDELLLDALAHVTGLLAGLDLAPPPGPALGRAAEALAATQKHVEMLSTVLGVDFLVHYEDFQDPEALGRLTARLVDAEHYSLAVFICRRYELDARSVWLRWGCELLNAGQFPAARSKLACAANLGLSALSSPSPTRQPAEPASAEAAADAFAPEAIADAAVRCLENRRPLDLGTVRQVAAQMEKMAVSRRSGSLSADTFMSMLTLPEGARGVAASMSPVRSPALDAGGGEELGAAAIAEIQFYLKTYAPRKLVRYLFKRERYAEAFALALAAAAPTRGTVQTICRHAIESGQTERFYRFLAGKVAADPGAMAADRLADVVAVLREERLFQPVYQFQLLAGDAFAAGKTCLVLAERAGSAAEAQPHVERAQAHFGELLASDTSLRAIAGELLRLQRLVELQLDVLAALHQAGAPAAAEWNIIAEDEHALDRRMGIVASILGYDFHVAFQVLQEFRLDSTQLYLQAVRQLIDSQRSLDLFQSGLESKLKYLLGHIKATCTTEAFDEVGLGIVTMLAAAPHGYATAKRVVGQLSGPRAMTVAWLTLGKLPKALASASASGSPADVKLVAANARMAGDVAILRKCEQRLEEMQRG